MKLRASFGLSATLGFVALCATGCPPPPADSANEQSNGSTSTPTNSNENAPGSGQAAPSVPPPSGDTTTVVGSPPGGAGDSSSAAGSGGTTAAGESHIQFSSPGSLLRMRPGGGVQVAYLVADPAARITTTELILVRDDNSDGAADGPPVYTRAITSHPGTNVNSLATDDQAIAALLVNGYGRFRVGIRARQTGRDSLVEYASGGLILDAVPPTGSFTAPAADWLTNRTTLSIGLATQDNSPISVRIVLDPDADPTNHNETALIASATISGVGDQTSQYAPALLTAPVGQYHVYAELSDGIAPPTGSYARAASGALVTIALTDRMIGNIDLDAATTSGKGAVLRGFNFNDLAGSSVSRVPDVNGDGRDELIVGSRFGKAHLIANNGVGFGEAYLIYGSAQRLSGTIALNNTGHGIPGVIFPGIRTPLNASMAPQNESRRWTNGLADITVIPDMDGDDLPEIAFSFPRVEAITLADSDPTIQHPDLVPDVPGMGTLEYASFDGMQWNPNTSQFTRGGVVIVSSHDELLRDPTMLNRKSDRVIDLQEVGQMFSGLNAMQPPPLEPYIRQAVRRSDLPDPRTGPFRVCADCDGLPPEDCDPEQEECGDDGCAEIGTFTDGREQMLERWVVQWDVTFRDQGPGGFFSPWTPIPADPPLSNGPPFPFPAPIFPFDYYPNHWVSGDACTVGCEVTNEWYVWSSGCTGTSDSPSWSTGGMPIQDPLPDCYPDNVCVVAGDPPPCGEPIEPCTDPEVTVDAGTTSVWSGFYGPCVQAFIATPTGTYPAPIGARILGQKVDDRFGSSISCDGTWAYFSSPERTANDAPYSADVPSIVGQRNKSGVVYQMRAHASLSPGSPTRTQLWIEPQPGLRPAPPCLPAGEDVIQPWWPYIDTEIGARADTTMPVPHQYMIECIGSLRGDPTANLRDLAFGAPGQTCPPPFDPGFDAPDLDACSAFQHPAGTAGYYMDRTPQIIGPHENAKIEFVRALGDVDGDGIRDFAVSSAQIRQDVINGAGPVVGGIFIVFGRPTGVEGDYLLEQLALDAGDPARLTGVLLKGEPDDPIARTIDDAGDVNNDGYADVLIGNEDAAGGAGEVILLYGSPTLISPGGGWTPSTIPAERIVRIRGAAAGDFAGANVAGAGDVDGDGFSDLLIAAPGAAGGRGETYLLYGGGQLPGTIALGGLSPSAVATPYAKFVGRNAGDFLGGGTKVVDGTDPGGGSTTAFSQGVAALGDIDGDGTGDFAIGAMLADPGGRIDSGEVYILYGKRGP